MRKGNNNTSKIEEVSGLNKLPQGVVETIGGLLRKDDIYSVAQTSVIGAQQFRLGLEAVITSENIVEFLNPEKAELFKEGFSGIVKFGAGISPEQIQRVCECFLLMGVSQSGNERVLLLDLSKTRLSTAQKIAVFKDIPEDLRSRIKVKTVGNIEVFPEDSASQVQELLQLLVKTPNTPKDEQENLLDFSKSGLDANKIKKFLDDLLEGKTLTTVVKEKIKNLINKGIVIQISGENQNSFIELITSFKVAKISSLCDTLLTDNLLEVIFPTTKPDHIINTSDLYLSLDQASRLDGQISLQERGQKISILNPTAEFLQVSAQIVDNITISNASDRSVFNKIVDFYENNVRSCAGYENYKIVNGQPILKEKRLGTVNCPVLFNDNGRMKSCAGREVYEIVNGRSVIKGKHLGTADCPVLFNDNGQMISCAGREAYEIVDGQSTLKHKYLGTVDCPVLLGDNGIMKSCAGVEIYELFGKSILKEKYLGTKDCPVLLGDNGRIKSFAGREFYDHTITGKLMICAKYLGTVDCPIVIDDNGLMKSCAHVELYDNTFNYAETFDRKSKYLGTADRPVLFDNNGTIRSCAEFRIGDEGYFGNCEFFQSRFRFMKSSKEGYPTKYDAFAKYENDKISSLTIHTKKGDLVFIKNQEGLLEIDKNSKLGKKIQEDLKIDPENLDSNRILQIKSDVEEKINESGISLRSFGRLLNSNGYQKV